MTQNGSHAGNEKGQRTSPYCWPVSFDDGTSRIGSDPFTTPVEARQPARRFRGRLAMPVTVWTSQSAARSPAGITVSSVLIADGTPPEVLGLIDPLSDFWDAAQESARLVVHILDADQTRLAEKFALRFPGDPFEGEQLLPTSWGPAIATAAPRASCTLLSSADAGYLRLVRARIDGFELGEEPVRPLVHYRGRYMSVGPLRS
jgi:3-hydroxy-9,10-secoandrosta-1,3,5(10)-triene-9,17-dione monooxygenase reductase component